MECLSPDSVAAYLASAATATGLAETEAHIDECESCRHAVAATIRAGRAESSVDVGTRVGRYVVQALRATGAMGHVLEARDPELDRAVAIKIVRHYSEDANERALREARALARIAHPNVVAVHDVGTWDGGVFVAMELVEGTTVRDWLAEPRAPRETIRLFAEVARGLAAAHAAGLVHRDIKPDNLLVGTDGRVRILDFGLATDATTLGERSGTPAYMAPEQTTGDATAASDQYAFAVTLFEALEGTRPTSAMKFRRTPRWARPVIERALSKQPELRHATMIEVARRLQRSRRALAIGAALAIALVISIGAFAFRSEPSTCDSPQDSFEAVRAGLAAKSGPILADQAVAKLSAWQARATVLRSATCKAMHADEPGATARLRCVDAVTRDVHVAVSALAHPNEVLALHALETIDRISDLSPCTGAEVPVAIDPFLDAGFRTQLTRIAVVDAGGDWVAAERGALALAKQLDQDRTRSLEARAWMLVGRSRMTARRVVEAREAFERALVAAELAGDDALRGDIYLALVGANLDTTRRAEARRWLGLGRALLTKIGDPARTWRVGLMDGAIDDDPTRGAATLRAALEGYSRSVSGEDENTVRLLTSLGNVLESAHQLPDAIATLRRAISVGERVLGPAHPALIQPLQELAYCLAEAGQAADAIPVAQRALAIAESTHGDVGVSTVRLALELFRTDGQIPAALELVDRAVPLVIANDGAHSALTANVLQLRGILRSQVNKHDLAIDDFLHTLEIERTYLPPDSPDFIDLFEFLGRSQRALGRTEDAIRSFEEARSIRGRLPDHKPIDDVGVETALGGVLVDAGRIDEGLPHLDKALALAREGTDREAIAFAETEVAKALIAAKRDRGRAHQLLRNARAAYKALDANEQERLKPWSDELHGLGE